MEHPCFLCSVCEVLHLALFSSSRCHIAVSICMAHFTGEMHCCCPAWPLHRFTAVSTAKSACAYCESMTACPPYPYFFPIAHSAPLERMTCRACKTGSKRNCSRCIALLPSLICALMAHHKHPGTYKGECGALYNRKQACNTGMRNLLKTLGKTNALAHHTYIPSVTVARKTHTQTVCGQSGPLVLQQLETPLHRPIMKVPAMPRKSGAQSGPQDDHSLQG